MVNKAQWLVLPYDAIKHLPNLRISPMGCVPQHDRRPRTIVDYTFFGLNDDTVPIAPRDAMQFGNALPRLLRHVVLADPAHGPVQLIKVDIADGFYRIGVRPPDVLKLGVAFPTEPGQPQLVAFPITLPMGWTNSPPIFCAATETIADLANEGILKWRNPPPHRLDESASTAGPLPPTPSLPTPTPDPHEDHAATPANAGPSPPPSSLSSAPRCSSRAALGDGRPLRSPRSRADNAAFPAFAGKSPPLPLPHCRSVPQVSSRAALGDERSLRSQGPREDNAAYPAKAGLSPPLPLPRKDESAIPTSCVAHTLPPPLPTPLLRDPHLHHPNRRQLATIDVFVDDFIGAAQGPPARLNRVRRILLTAVDQVFRPVDPDDSIYRNEPSSVKKMLQGDANWGTCKTILGWIIDTVAMTISLPPRRLQRLADILAEIPLSQKRTSVKRWHQILGELRSMSLAIPGARGLFSHMQDALCHKEPKGRLTLRQGVHDALHDFRLLHDDLAHRPTRLYELVPLAPTLLGSHDASGKGAGGVWLPTAAATPRLCPLYDATHPVPSPPHASTTHPVVWRARFDPAITANLVSWNNPHGTITNSDLELAGSLLHHEAAAQCFDVRERTILSKTDNTPTLFWQRKGSTTSTGAPAYLLRAQALHQRHHRYIPRHDFIAGLDNSMSDDASRMHDLTDAEFLTHFNSTYPQSASWQLWTPTPNILSAVTSSLHRTPCDPVLLLNVPPEPTPTGNSGPISVTNWPSTPYSPTSKTQLPSSKSLPSDTAPVPSRPKVSLSDLAPLKMPYGVLGRRSRVWGNPTHV